MNQHQREHEHSHWRKIVRQLNFYRVHNIFLYGFDISGVFNLIGSCRSAFTPLCVSIIFYVCNGRYKISYIDSLFNCFSAMTVCGLATIDLGALTGSTGIVIYSNVHWQSGEWNSEHLSSPVHSDKLHHSWTYSGYYFVGHGYYSKVRILPGSTATYTNHWDRFFFAQRFESVLRTAVAEEAGDAVSETRDWPHRIALRVFSGRRRIVECSPAIRKTSPEPDMIRRLDNGPKPVTPDGWVPESQLSKATSSAEAPACNNLGRTTKWVA